MAKQRNRWQATYPVLAYEAARQGCNLSRIAMALGTKPEMLTYWRKTHPELDDAIRRGQKAARETTTLRDYVYSRLPPHLKRLWDRIDELSTLPDGIELVERLLKPHGKEVRQHLFFHALVNSDFSPTAAAAKVGISRQLLEHWKYTDPDFAELIGEVQTWKKDFAESCLFRLLQQGDTAATIFVNRTLNRDRGYSEKVDLNLTANVNHEIDFDKLSVETKRAILEELRLREANGVLEGDVPRLMAPPDEEEDAA